MKKSKKDMNMNNSHLEIKLQILLASEEIVLKLQDRKVEYRLIILNLLNRIMFQGTMHHLLRNQHSMYLQAIKLLKKDQLIDLLNKYQQ